MHDSRVTPGRMVPSRGGVITSRPKSPHEIPVTKGVSQIRTITIFAFDHNEEIHTSGLGDFHPQKITISVTEEPEDLLITFSRCFLLG